MKTAADHHCGRDEHTPVRRKLPSAAMCRNAADLFRALADPARLKILCMLMLGEMCVSQIAVILEDSLSSVSQRLKLLRSERIVSSRRAGKHVFYALADQHVSDLVKNALAHTNEPGAGRRGRLSNGIEGSRT